MNLFGNLKTLKILKRDGIISKEFWFKSGDFIHFFHRNQAILEINIIQKSEIHCYYKNEKKDQWLF